VLDGILETPGRILIMTTNDPSVLFNALVRPGRMDLKIEVGNCDRAMIIDFLSYFYDESRESVTELIRGMAYESELAQAEVSCIIQNSMFSLPGAIKEMREKLQADAEATKEATKEATAASQRTGRAREVLLGRLKRAPLQPIASTEMW